ncbi:MAG: hypothetical protein QXD63_02175 [Candidatus Pacearchaeota archaeon]
MKKIKTEYIEEENNKKSLVIEKNIEKALIFDSGALISFSINGITDIIKKLKSTFSGKFLITNEVKKEVIDNPIKIKKFQLEALKIRELLKEKVLELPDSLGIDNYKVQEYTDKFLQIANSIFIGDNKNIHIIDAGEASCLGLSKLLREINIKNLIVIDERTTRMLVEKHENLKEFLEKKLHVKILVNHENLKYFQNFSIIRSPELAYVAWKKNMVDLKDGPIVLDALLYALKFKGASISEEEIREIERIK